MKNNRSQTHIENLPVNQFLEKMKETPNAVLLDVRTPREFADGNIQGAQNIDFFRSDFKEEVAKLDPNKSYFIYCRSGKRSYGACQELKNAGIENAFNMDGGFMAYERLH